MAEARNDAYSMAFIPRPQRIFSLQEESEKEAIIISQKNCSGDEAGFQNVISWSPKDLAVLKES